VVFRVSRMTTPVPCTASTNRRVSVATPESKASASGRPLPENLNWVYWSRGLCA
jgi:hypothetical protein